MSGAGRWIAVLGDAGFADLERSGMRELRLAVIDAEARPAIGDAVDLVHRGCFVGSAEVTKQVDAERFRLRRIVRVPHGATLPFTAFVPPLACARGWTHEGLDDLTESFVSVEARDHDRIEEALLALARRYGPPPTRPAHRRPRTPGRRRLVAARATVYRRAG